MKPCITVLLAATAFLPGGLLAQTESATNRVAVPPQDDSYFERLQSDDPNYLVYAYPLESGSLKDDAHAEFYLSIKYAFNLWSNTRPWQPDRLAVVYNGLYDFYLLEGGRYESAPIISRRQNPGVALEWNLAEQGVFRLGYFHESNGQSIDDGDDKNGNGIDDGAEAFALANEKGGYEYALAQTSRGWEYTSMRYQQSGGGEWPWLYQLELRLFMERQGAGTFDKEDAVFWEPVAKQPTIQDYDGLRAMFEIPVYKDLLMVRADLKTGSGHWESLEHFGGKYSLNMAIGRNIWLTTFYFNGYGKEPSTYHLRTEYAGIGVEFR